MKRTTKTRQKKYVLLTEKFFTTEERTAIIECTEAKSIVDLAKGRQTWPVRWMLVHLAFYTGLRVSEIAALTMADVLLSRKDPYICVRSGKGGKARDVYIEPNLVKHLREFVHIKRNWNQSTAPEAPLFAGRTGHCTTTTLHLSFKAAVKASGLRNELSIHGARHTYAVMLYHETKDMKAVQLQLGHSNMNMTSLYADIMPEERGAIVAKLSNTYKPLKPTKP